MQSHSKDLRTFLKILDDRRPGEVLRVDTRDKTFDLAECDAAAFLAKLKAGGKRPAIFASILVPEAPTSSSRGARRPGR